MKKLSQFGAALLGWLLAVACESPPDPPPNDLLTPAQMTAILVDIHLLEARISDEGLPLDSARALYQVHERDLLASHATDTAQYYRSYRHYSAQVATFDRIYADVVDSLGVLESRAKPSGEPE